MHQVNPGVKGFPLCCSSQILEPVLPVLEAERLRALLADRRELIRLTTAGDSIEAQRLARSVGVTP